MAQYDLKMSEVVRQLNATGKIKYRFEGGFNKVSVIGRFFKADFAVVYPTEAIMDTKIDALVSEVRANIEHQCKQKYSGKFSEKKQKKTSTGRFVPTSTATEEFKIVLNKETADKLRAISKSVSGDVNSIMAQAIEFALSNM